MSLEESKISSGSSHHSPLHMQDFIKLFQSPSHWTVPIESFIEAYCLIFTPDDEQEESIQPEEQEERVKIFGDYKKLIMEILADTVMRRRKHVKFSTVLSALGEYFSDDHFLSDQNVFDSLKYLLAVEDIKVFTVFMEDMNIILNDQSQNKVEEEIAKIKAQQKQLKEEALKHMKTAQQTPRHEIELAIKLSLQEEETRKQRELSLQQQEDEALRAALEESLQFSKEFNSKSKTTAVNISFNQSHHDGPASKTMMIDSVPETFNQSFSRLNQTSDFRIKKRGKRQVPLVKIQAQSNISPEKKEEKAETIEERRQRLRATRDALFQMKQIMIDQPIADVSVVESSRGKEEQARLQRCLKVLKEAADEVFSQPNQNSVADLTSINSTVVAGEDLNESFDANKVSNKFRRARMLNQMVAGEMMNKSRLAGEDAEAHILEQGFVQDRSLPLPK